MTFKPFVSPHVHPQSLDSGSTPEAFAEREIELGTGYLTVTDHGSLGAVRKVYDLAKVKGLTPILGIEAYFFDAECPILKSFGIQDAKKYNKYYHLTIHALDQAAYETIVRLLSKAPTERHGSELKPLFNWRDLEEIGAQNVTFTSGCLIGMVQRHVLNHNRVDIAEAYYRRLAEIVKPDHFFVEVFPHRCDKNWVNGVFVTYEDNSVDKFYDNKLLSTEKGGEIKAIELAKAFGRKGHEADRLLAVQNYSKWDERNKAIVGVKKISDFMPNECRPWAPDGDVQLGCNRVVQYFAGKYGHKILISDDSHYAHPDERIVQDIRLASMGDNFKFYGNYHRQSSEEAYAYFAQYMQTDRATFEGWIDNSHAWAEKFKGFKFDDRVSLPKSFYPTNTLGHLKALIDKHGRMDWTNAKYVERLKAEVAMIQANGKIDLLPYFFLAEEAIAQFAAQEQLTGPGRGSAAGMLLTYLLGITHADPLRYNLSMERFLTKTRILSGKLPDIDMDLPNRDILTDPDKGWLKQRFGECYAQISVDTSMKVKSSIRDVARATYGKIPDEIEKLSKKMAMPPQGISDRDYVFGYSGTDGWVKGAIDTDEFLKEYIAKYPKQWDIVVKCLGVVRNKGRHASAYVVTDEPVSNFIPLQLVSDVRVTQYTAGPVEKSGGVKMDFLGLNTLLDISEALKLIRSRASGNIEGTYKLDGKAVPYYRVVPFNGKLYDVWDLPSDHSVLDTICKGETDTVFQFNTDGAKKWLKEFNFLKADGSGHKALDSIEALAAFTALDRPGPLDAMVVDDLEQPVHNMLVEYAKRAKGEQGYGRMPLLDKLFPETHGIIVYQEQLEMAFREIGGTTADQAEAFRRDIAKKEMAKVLKHRDLFMPGAIAKLGEDEAKKLWSSMETFGQYGFNKSVDGDTILPFKGGSKALKDFEAGDVVFCVDEFGAIQETEVVDLHDHGELEGFEVEFDDGTKVICSANHKFLTTEGQKPLYAIVNSGLGVLSQSEGTLKQTKVESSEEVSSMLFGQGQDRGSVENMDGPLRSRTSQSEGSGNAPEGMSSVYCAEDGEYQSEDAGTQYSTRETSSCVQGRQNYFCSQGHSASKSGTATRMAEGQPREITSQFFESGRFAQEVESGNVASVNGDIDMGTGADSLRGGTEASGLRQSGPQDLGGSGRVLPFLSAEGQQTVVSAGENSVSGQHVESGSSAARGCDVDSSSRGLFQRLGRANEGRVANVAYSEAPLASTGDLVLRRVVRVRPVGIRKMHDLEVAHPKHNYLLGNGVVTSNSHAVCYSLIGYACAFLKYHYPLEWWTAVLRNASKDEVNEKFWKHCGHLINLPDISKSTNQFDIVGDRIQAPLSLLHGIGEGAHKEMCELRPFTSLEDFCQKVQARREKLSTMVEKKKKDKKTGAETLVMTKKMGHSALNRGVVYKLIVSGAMDSLFPGMTDTNDMLEQYERVLAQVSGKKPVKVKAEFINLSPLVRYQMRKAILPAYSQPLLPILNHPQIVLEENGLWVYRYGNKKARFAPPRFIDHLNTLTPFVGPYTVATASYVVSSRRFRYGGDKEAMELVLDVDSARYTSVLWPGKKGKLPADLADDLTGAVIVAVWTKTQEAKPFQVVEVEVIQSPLGAVQFEESPDAVEG